MPDLGDADGEGCAVLLIIIIVIVLLAIIFEMFVLVWFWFRSVYRALMRRGEAASLTPPGLWTRMSHRVDAVERWMPMNDLVFRVFRGVRRTLSRLQPWDGELGSRVLAAAKAGGNRVAALEMQVHEGLDAETALAVGARLVGGLDGSIEVDDDGEIWFVFPPGSLASVNAPVDRDIQKAV